MKALVLPNPGHPVDNFKVDEIEKPTPGPSDLLVKIHSTALNPVDYKMAHYGFLIKKLPIVLGCDMSGVVEAVGSDVKNFKVGDEVFGFLELGTPSRGTFAEYCLIGEDLAFRKTSKVSFEEASTFGVGLLTAVLGINDNFGIPLPSTNPQSKYANEFFLVWGASSSVGSFAVQIAALSGFKVIATASKKNFDLVKSCGALEVFDYSSSDVVEQIVKYTNGSLHYAYDPIATDDTVKAITACLSKEGQGHISGTSPSKLEFPSNIKYHPVFLGAMPNQPEVRKRSTVYVQEYSKLIEEGKIKPNVVEKLEGLENVKKGLQLLIDNKVGGKKVVVTY